MFNVNYTLSRLKAMLKTRQLKHAITYDVKIFIRYHKESEIFISIVLLFSIHNFKKLNKVVDTIKHKVYPRTCHESLEGK